MNENLNLAEILKDCPKGTRLYSPMFGNVELVKVHPCETKDFPILIKTKPTNTERQGSCFSFATNGIYYGGLEDTECLLFPSKKQRDWSKFEAAFIPDKALVWCWDDDDLFQRILRFYDAKNQSTFSKASGLRDDIVYEHYEIFKGEEPEWATEARKNLKD